MKRLLILVILSGLLSGCAGELRDEAAQSTNYEVLGYVVKYQPACNTDVIAESLYQPNVKEMAYRESKHQMDAQKDADAIHAQGEICAKNIAARAEANRLEANYQAQKHQQDYQRDEQLERICEAVHPYMVSQCMVNSGINEMVDSL